MSDILRYVRDEDGIGRLDEESVEKVESKFAQTLNEIRTLPEEVDQETGS